MGFSIMSLFWQLSQTYCAMAKTIHTHKQTCTPSINRRIFIFMSPTNRNESAFMDHLDANEIYVTHRTT